MVSVFVELFTFVIMLNSAYEELSQAPDDGRLITLSILIVIMVILSFHEKVSEVLADYLDNLGMLYVSTIVIAIEVQIDEESVHESYVLVVAIYFAIVAEVLKVHTEELINEEVAPSYQKKVVLLIFCSYFERNRIFSGGEDH